MNALIVANMTGGKVVDGIYKTFRKDSVVALSNKKVREGVKKADDFMAHVRVLLRNMKMDKVDAFKLTIKNDVRAAYVLTKKHNTKDDNFKTIDDVVKADLVKRRMAKGSLQRVLHRSAEYRYTVSFIAPPKGLLQRVLRLCRRLS